MLIIVLFTEEINGARSWFNIGSFSFQPSEFAKLAVVLLLASAFYKNPKITNQKMVYFVSSSNAR